MKILVTPTSLQPGKGSAALCTLEAFADELIFNEKGRPLTEDELIPLIKDCDGYIAGLDFITANVIKAADKLKVISRYGVGYDRVDIETAGKMGIPVTNTPGVNAEAVGELTFALILALVRRIPYLNNSTRTGGWVRSTGMELKGKVISILGLGAIGKVTARCAKGFDMKVLAYDPYINEEYCVKHDIGIVSLDEALTQSDVISLHLPLNDNTKHMINAEAFSKMKSSCILINASRGGLIDENAAYTALKEGRLGGLGLDAFEIEPPEKSNLFEFDNVVATPHTGAHTKEATDNMAKLSVKNLIDVLRGEDCPYIVNKFPS